MIQVSDRQGEKSEFPGMNVSVVAGDLWIMDSDDAIMTEIPAGEWIEFVVSKAERRHGKRAML